MLEQDIYHEKNMYIGNNCIQKMTKEIYSYSHNGSKEYSCKKYVYAGSVWCMFRWKVFKML